MHEIVRVSPNAPGAYSALMAGAGQSAGGETIALGYSLSGVPCGALVADCLDSSLLLRWICVDASFQNRGIAGRLLEALLARAKQAEIVSVDAVVCLAENQHSYVEALLRQHGFMCAETRPVFRLPLSSVLSGPLAAGIRTISANVAALNTLRSYQLRDFNHHIVSSGYEKIRPEELLQESRVWLENDRVTGCILFAPCGGDIELRWIYGSGSEVVRGLSTAGAAALAERYPPETVIHAAALLPTTGKLLKRISGKDLESEATVARWHLGLI